MSLTSSISLLDMITEEQPSQHDPILFTRFGQIAASVMDPKLPEFKYIVEACSKYNIASRGFYNDSRLRELCRELFKSPESNRQGLLADRLDFITSVIDEEIERFKSNPHNEELEMQFPASTEGSSTEVLTVSVPEDDINFLMSTGQAQSSSHIDQLIDGLEIRSASSNTSILDSGDQEKDKQSRNKPKEVLSKPSIVTRSRASSVASSGGETKRNEASTIPSNTRKRSIQNLAQPKQLARDQALSDRGKRLALLKPSLKTKSKSSPPAKVKKTSNSPKKPLLEPPREYRRTVAFKRPQTTSRDSDKSSSAAISESEGDQAGEYETYEDSDDDSREDLRELLSRKREAYYSAASSYDNSRMSIFEKHFLSLMHEDIEQKKLLVRALDSIVKTQTDTNALFRLLQARSEKHVDTVTRTLPQVAPTSAPPPSSVSGVSSASTGGPSRRPPMKDIII